MKLTSLCQDWRHDLGELGTKLDRLEQEAAPLSEQARGSAAQLHRKLAEMQARCLELEKEERAAEQAAGTMRGF